MPKHNKKQNKKNGPAQESAEHRSVVPYTMYSRVAPVALRLRSWLKYCEVVTMTTSSGPGFILQTYSLNSLFDPNVTGTGHQPRGFDQLAGLYQRYRVYRTRWELVVTPATTSADVALVAVQPSNSGAPSSFNDTAEQTFGVVRPISREFPTTIRGAADLAKLNGKTSQAYMSDDTTQAQITTSPSEVLYLHVAITNPGGNAVAYTTHITLWYDSEFSDPSALAQS